MSDVALGRIIGGTIAFLFPVVAAFLIHQPWRKNR